MSQQIIEILEYLFEKFGIAVDWTAENIWPYVQELGGKIVTYKIVSNSIGVLLSAILLICGGVFFGKFIKSWSICKLNKKDTLLWDYYSSGCCPTGLGFGSIIGFNFILIIGLIGLCCTVSALLGWTIIPEIQLVEYIANLVNNAAV